MNNRKLYLKTNLGLTTNALKTLMELVENQNTTDQQEPGDYVVIDNDDIHYFYTVDEEYDIVLTNIIY